MFIRNVLLAGECKPLYKTVLWAGSRLSGAEIRVPRWRSDSEQDNALQIALYMMEAFPNDLALRRLKSPGKY